MEVCRKILSSQYGSCEAGGIIMGKDMDTLGGYLIEMIPKSRYKVTRSFLSGIIYKPMYYLTNDRIGAGQLQFIISPEKYTPLYSIMMKGLKPHNKTFPVEHDALTKDGYPVLFTVLLDIPRLIQFKNGLVENPDKRGYVIGLNFQQDMLQRYLGEGVKITGMNFQKIGKNYLGWKR